MATPWEHEWEEHGSCSRSEFSVDRLLFFLVKSVLDYFTLALNIKDRLYIMNAFKKENIQPDAMKTYDHADVEKAIVNAIGKKKKNPELCIWKNKQIYLNEVGLCLEHDGMNYNDCSPPLRSNAAAALCKKNFILLPP